MALGDVMQLRLWHELIVLPLQAQSFEYVNCHDRTGLLSAAHARAGTRRTRLQLLTASTSHPGLP